MKEVQRLRRTVALVGVRASDAAQAEAIAEEDTRYVHVKTGQRIKNRMIFTPTGEVIQVVRTRGNHGLKTTVSSTIPGHPKTAGEAAFAVAADLKSHPAKVYCVGEGDCSIHPWIGPDANVEIIEFTGAGRFKGRVGEVVFAGYPKPTGNTQVLYDLYRTNVVRV